MGSAASGGGSWDFSFPVELSGGKKMTLRWNRGEQPQDVANRFLQENGLPANHMPDVLAFVTQQLQGQSSSGGGQTGQTYSYPVEVMDGRRLTITWTHGENPMAVAQRFAAQNMIPAQELPDIVNFVAQVQGSAPAAAAPPVPFAPSPD